MGQGWKTLLLVFILCLFSTSLSACRILGSCNRVMKVLSRTAFKPDPGPFVPFTLIPREKEGIDHPEHAWTYRWSEDDKNILSEPPSIDENSNVYLLDYKLNLYAIDFMGELTWTKKRIFGPMEFCKEGMLIIPFGLSNLRLVDYQDKTLWKSNVSPRNLVFTPNGFLICSSYNSLLSLDVQGKRMWHTYIEDESYEYFSLYRSFFDEDSNGYYIFRAYLSGQGLRSYHHIMISLGPEGEIRWKKLLSDDETLQTHFLPHKDSLVKDSFLLAYHSAVMDEDRDGIYTAQLSLPKRIVAYCTKGEELWEKEESRGGNFDKGYAIGTDHRFYYSFNEYDIQDEYWDVVSGHLICQANDGQLLWSKELEGIINSGLVLDKDNHIYLSMNDSENKLCAFFPDGSEKWQIPIDYQLDYSYPLFLGPQRTIHIVAAIIPLISCIRDKE